MTIFTSKVSDKKEENEAQSPEVVTDCMLLLDNEKNEAIVPKHHVLVTAASAASAVAIKRKRFGNLHICVALIVLPLGIALMTGCIWIYKHIIDNEQYEVAYIGRCGVDYHQIAHVDPMMPRAGKFEQQIEIDEDYERIMVPAIGDTKQATILHDFNMNVTAIIDKEKRHCFVMPLDRTLVMPPKDFWDLLIKLKSGYFLLDAEVLRTNYRAITPPIDDLTVFGTYIKDECQYFDTYLLAKEGEPVAMSKRSACEFSGDKYCLGDAGADKMVCFKITGCM